jgi:hypothetical protein
MKNKFSKQSSRAFCLLIFVNTFLLFKSFSQNPPNMVLVLKKGNHIEKLYEGKKVKIWNEGERYTGYIDSICTESIFIDGKDFDIENINKIGFKLKGNLTAGKILVTTGLLVGTLGGVIFYSANDEENLFAVLFIKFYGLIFEAIGIPATLIGGTLLLIEKKYRKNQGWEFKAVQIN